jgi:hypothetical protein
MKYKKTKKFIILFSILLIILLIGIPITSYALGAPVLVTRFSTAFIAIKNWLLTISTPVAAVSIIIGFLMKKLSFGDEERMRIGKKLVRNSFVSYIFILMIDLIIDAVQFIAR